jgi:hypothetical protein
MYIAPFTRLTPLDPSDASRLGPQEAARQAALLRVPGHAEEQAKPPCGEMVSRPVPVPSRDDAE